MNPASKVASIFVTSLALSSKLHAHPLELAFQDALDSQAQSPLSRALRFDIPSGPMAEVMDRFERATGLSIGVDDDAIKSITSAGVTGTFTISQALSQILTGTSVAFRTSASGQISLYVAGGRDAVTVSGKTPTLSSPKYTEPLRNTPQTITVVPADVMAAQGATSLRDVLRNVSGITFQAGEGGVPAGDQMSIRGFSARTDMFVDGVRDTGGYTRDPFVLEQLEVTKGPSSSISGRGSTGGAINQVSKIANLTNSQAAAVSLGNADTRRITIDVNQPLSQLSPSAALRFNGMFMDAGVPGRDAVHGRRWGAAPALGLGLGRPTRLHLTAMYLGQNNLPEYGLPWVPANTNPSLAAYANGRPPVASSNFYGLKARDYEKTTTTFGTADLQHDAGPTTLRNVTRLGETRRDSVTTAPRFVSVNTSTAINRQLQSRDMTDSVVSNQSTITSRFATGPISHAVSAGIEFSSERSENFARTGPAAPAADLFSPNPNEPFVGPIVRTGAATRGRAISRSAYVFDTIHLGQAVDVTAGGRFDHFDVDFDSTAATGIVTHFDRLDKIWSGRAAVTYKPARSGSFYVGHGTSSNPSAEGLSLSATTVDLAPERTKSIEAGTKWDFTGGRTSLSAAVFRTDKVNARTPGVNAGDPPTVLAGRQRVDGAEFGVSGQPTEHWAVFATATLMKSDILASGVPAEVDASLPLTPKRTMNIWSTVQLPGRLTVGGGAQFMDTVFRTATNATPVPSYWLLNGTASRPIGRRLTLRANFNNLANADYVDRVGGGHFIPGPRRSALLTADVRW